MKKPQSLGLVWEQKNHSASQPQPAFYFSVTLQSISPFPALLSTRDTFSHSTGVIWYPKKPNHKQSNIFPFRFPSPHKHTHMRGVSSGMPGESYAILLWKTDTGLVTSCCFLYWTYVWSSPLLCSALCKHSKNQIRGKYKKSKVKYNLAKMNRLFLASYNFWRSSSLSCGKWTSVQGSKSLPVVFQHQFWKLKVKQQPALPLFWEPGHPCLGQVI